jgi:hypothetical protein
MGVVYLAEDTVLGRQVAIRNMTVSSCLIMIIRAWGWKRPSRQCTSRASIETGLRKGLRAWFAIRRGTICRWRSSSVVRSKN